MSRTPFAVITDQGAVVRTDVLDEYAVKSSQQLPTQSTFEGQGGLYRPRYDPAQLAGLLELSTPHLVACRQKAEDVVGRGWELVPAVKDADPAVRDRIAAWLEEIPLPDQALGGEGYDSVFTAAQFDFESIGRGVLELVRVDKDPRGEPEMLVHVPAHTVRLARDGIRFIQSRGGKRRWFKWAGAPYDLDYESGELKDLGGLRPERRANEIIWWRNYHSRDPVYGLPDVIPAIGAIHGDLGRRDYNIDFFANYGVPAYAVFITGDFDPGDPVDADGNPVDDTDPAGRTPLEWQIDNLLKQVRDNPHSNLVFTIPTVEGREDGEVKIEFKPLSTEVKEASFRLYRKDNREEVLSSHRMSSAIAGVYDAGASNREARGQYKQSVVYPRRRLLEKVVNHFVVAAFGTNSWRWTLVALDSRDDKHQLDLAEISVRNASITPREFRRIAAPLLGISKDVDEDIDDPALDLFYLNGVPLAATGSQDEAAAALRGLRDDMVTMAAKSNGSPADAIEWALTP